MSQNQTDVRNLISHHTHVLSNAHSMTKHSLLFNTTPWCYASIDGGASASKALTILKQTVTLCPAHVPSRSGGYMGKFEHFQECVSIKYDFVL